MTLFVFCLLYVTLGGLIFFALEYATYTPTDITTTSVYTTFLGEWAIQYSIPILIRPTATSTGEWCLQFVSIQFKRCPTSAIKTVKLC